MLEENLSEFTPESGSSTPPSSCHVLGSYRRHLQASPRPFSRPSGRRGRRPGWRWGERAAGLPGGWTPAAAACMLPDADKQTDLQTRWRAADPPLDTKPGAARTPADRKQLTSGKNLRPNTLIMVLLIKLMLPIITGTLQHYNALTQTEESNRTNTEPNRT